MNDKNKDKHIIKILIVDDEIPFLEHMKTYDYSKHNFQCVGFAKNGKEALEICMNNLPHIIISDINMPVMDGIELMKIINSNFPSIKFIILTIHESFAYAQSAIVNNVSAYIVKGTNIEKELFEILEIIKKKIPKSQLSDDYSYNNSLLKINKISYLWHGKFDSSRFIKSLDTIIYKHCNVYGLKIYNKEFDINMLLASIHTYLMQLNASKDTIKVVFVHELSIFYIISNNKSQYEKSIIESILLNISENDILYYGLYKYNILDQICFENYINKTLDMLPYGFYSIRSSMNNIDNLLVQNLKEMDSILSYKWTNEITRIGINEEEFERFMKIILRHIVEEKYLPQDIIALYKIWIKKFRFKYSTTKENKTNVNINDFSTIYKTTKTFLNEIKEIIKNSKGMVYEVALAIEFIKENIYNNDLQLNEVSDYVHVSKGYLSILLKKNCGIGFQKLLLDMRMEKASEMLLNTTKKVYEISDMIGYLNPRSFTKAFSSYYGVSPKKYKNKELKNEKHD